MLALAAWVLAAAAAIGVVILVLPMHYPALATSWIPGAAHGLVGIAGTVLLALSLGGPARGVSMGAGSFGLVAAGLFATGLLLAAALAVARWRRRRPSVLLIGLHATAAVGGLTLLAAYLSFPP